MNVRQVEFRRPLMAVLACAMLCVSATWSVAQPGPGAAPGGNRGRGGFRMMTPPGPPAPVPDEVKMPRPTAEEIAKMNADLKQFIETSPDKELLQKYAALLVVTPPRDNSCIRPTAGGVRGGRHQAFVETAKNGDFDILFHGDSITDWWAQAPEQGGGKAVFDKYFGDVKTANFAVAGDTTQGVLWGLQNGEGQGHKPKVIMLMLGTNNAAGGASGAEIAEGVGAVVLELRKDFPDAKILLLAIFPRGSSPADQLRQKNEVANKIIAKLDDQKHVFFMNINDKFLDEKGALIGFRPDNLHPNAQGYEIWAQAVAAKLKDMLK